MTEADAMRAVAVAAPDELRTELRRRPTLRPGEVLVRVAAAGVNRHDIGQRKREMAGCVAAEPWPQVGTSLRAAIDRVYPLEDAAEAHRRIESRAAIGKVVLRVRASSPQ